ncbi:hypothetical protein BESB_007630 [Besnoitia besnoiti]|uniref:RAP domain-containing protein n=1 Tax=Besnoitia besnoiti TaxID=94643 RepID=A0A2A9MP60_BESBE|nr:hypothetical protein BESB_007630 [Besnoitia besnoiti]PFH38421.1 hypothetical protein BESB_007630 [Besnoitia besnoiti]
MASPLGCSLFWGTARSSLSPSLGRRMPVALPALATSAPSSFVRTRLPSPSLQSPPSVGASAAALSLPRARRPSGASFLSSASEAALSFSLLQDSAPLSLEAVLQIIDFRLKEKKFVSFAHECEPGHPAASVGLTPGEFVVALNRVAAAARLSEAANLREGRAHARGEETVWRDVRFQKFLGRLKRRVLAFQPAELYRALLAFSRLKHCPEDLLVSILRLLETSTWACPAESDAAAASGRQPDGLGALSPLQLSHLPLLLCSLSEGAPRVALHSFLQAYARFLAAGARVSPPAPSATAPQGESAALESAPASAAPEQPACAADGFSLQELSFVALGLSTLGFRDLPLLHLLAGALQREIRATGASARACGAVGAPADSLRDASRSIALATSLLSFATLGVNSPRLYQELLGALRGSLHTLPPAQLANVTLALATLTRDSGGLFPFAFLADLEATLEAQCAVMDGEDALTAAWAGCALSLHQGNPTLFRRLLDHSALLLAPAAQDREGDEAAETLSRQQKRQLTQIRLDLLLDASTKTRDLCQDLKEGETWEWLLSSNRDGGETEETFEEEDEEEGIVALPPAARDAEEEVFQLLTSHPEAKQLLLRAASGESASPQGEAADAGDEEASVERNSVACEFYRIPVSICRGGERGGVAVVVDFSTFPDLAEPSDLFLALKYRHMRLQGYTLVDVRLTDWQQLEGDDARVAYLLSRLTTY